MAAFSLLIIDDHALVGEAWSAILSTEKDLQVVAVTNGVEKSMEVLQQQRIDLVLLDVNMKPVSGFDMAQMIRKVSADTRILAVSMYDQPAIVKKMIRSGASGYISKNAPKSEMLQAIRGLLRGKTYISSDIQARMADELADAATGANTIQNIEKLTDKEREIMHLVEQGFTSKEIAGKLTISFKTVQVHRHNILKKLNLKNTASLLHFLNANNLFN